jgi:hypothetical protein
MFLSLDCESISDARHLLDNWFERATNVPWVGLKCYNEETNPITQGSNIRRFRKLRQIADFIPYFLVEFSSSPLRHFFKAFIIIKIVLCTILINTVSLCDIVFLQLITIIVFCISVDLLERQELTEHDLSWMSGLLQELNSVVIQICQSVEVNKPLRSMKLHRLAFHFGMHD